MTKVNAGMVSTTLWVMGSHEIIQKVYLKKHTNWNELVLQNICACYDFRVMLISGRFVIQKVHLVSYFHPMERWIPKSQSLWCEEKHKFSENLAADKYCNWSRWRCASVISLLKRNISHLCPNKTIRVPSLTQVTSIQRRRRNCFMRQKSAGKVQGCALRLSLHCRRSRNKPTSLRVSWPRGSL